MLVEKNHPRIVFRGMVDGLQAEILLCQLEIPEVRRQLGELLELAREIIRCDVLEAPLEDRTLCGLTQQELRTHSHRPQDFYGQPHFMPEVSDGEVILRLNLCRCSVREAELAAAAAFTDEKGVLQRPDILKALNRMSSMLYILMIQEKSGGYT